MSYFATTEVLDASGVPQAVSFKTGGQQPIPTALTNYAGNQAATLSTCGDKVCLDSKALLIDPSGIIATITEDGTHNRLDCNVTGSVVSIATGINSLPIQVHYQKAFSAINANEWQELASYMVPQGYRFSVLSFGCRSETSGETSRVYVEVTGGTFNCATNTFTDGSSVPFPQFGSGLYLYVTSTIGSAVNDVVTITYTNELGQTGRTCVITVTKSSAVGTSIEGNLEGSDIGVRDITNVTHSATGQAGSFKVDIYYNLFSLLISSANQQYQAVSIAGNPVTLDPGIEVVLAVLAGTKTSYIRNLSLFGTLDPITA